jgi:hypothetical protein
MILEHRFHSLSQWLVGAAGLEECGARFALGQSQGSDE